MRPEELIIKYLKNQLTPAEDKELQDWLNASEAHRQLFHRISDPEYIKERLIRRQRVNKQAEWAKVREAIFQDGQQEMPAAKKTIKIGWRRYWPAAAFTGLIVAGWLWIKYHPPAKTHNPCAKCQHKNKDIPPGGNKAILTLSDGTKLSLNNAGKGTIALQGNTRVEQSGKGRLTYNELNKNPGKIQYNTLTTPAAAQYQLTLPDGSRVWLNNSSSLRYPTAFTGGTREVELSGEAYFEIAHDASLPFNVIVHKGKNNMTARALGTSFNIKAYDDEGSIVTTLLSGKMNISKGDGSENLRPGQQARLDTTGRLRIRTDSNAVKAIAWKDGFFYFDEADLRTVMRTLARWYDIQVEYKAAINEHHQFVGHVPRNTNLSQVLEFLRGDGVEIRVEGKKVIIGS